MSKVQQAPRVLPADVYDALEFSALVYGGIGAGRSFDGPVPVCLFAHAEHADISFTALDSANISPVFPEYEDGVANDPAVRAINARLGNPDRDARVPFDALMAELNITRGA